KVLKPMSPWMRARVADSAALGGLLAVMDLQPHRKSGESWARPFQGIAVNSSIAGFIKNPKVTARLTYVLNQGEEFLKAQGRDHLSGVFKHQSGLLHVAMLGSYAQFQTLPGYSDGYDVGFVSSLYVVRALGDNGDPEAVPTLIDWSKDTNVLVRYNAIEALGKLGDRSGLDSVLQAFRNRGICTNNPGWVILADLVKQDRVREDGHSWARRFPNADKMAAAEALGKIGTDIAVDRLRDQLYQKIEISKRMRSQAPPKKVPHYGRGHIEHLIDILWIGVALDELGHTQDAHEALRYGMHFWEIIDPASEKDMAFKEPGMFAVGKYAQKWTLPVVERMMLHNWLTWKGNEYEPRSIARDAWERIVGRKERFDELRYFDLPWLY
ncbi:MAG: HEAT repeat domain-containing protein, partial [Planctomycetia bacterium]|nr:HEAT repeat domain-containing protein [Planctomycetia bacterium]